jgi:hypothetical protein
MAEAKQFPWSQSLYPIFNELTEKGRKLHEKGMAQYKESGGKDFHFKPFESLSEVLSASSEHELSLRAFAYANEKNFTDDASLCEFLGGDLDQCIIDLRSMLEIVQSDPTMRDNMMEYKPESMAEMFKKFPQFKAEIIKQTSEEKVNAMMNRDTVRQMVDNPDKIMFTINDEPFYKTTALDNEVTMCIKLFTTLEQKKRDLTSTQFLYILLGIQQKNPSVLTSAFKESACDALLKINKIDEHDSVNIRVIIPNYIPLDPSKIEINIVFGEEGSEDVLIFFKFSIPIEFASRDNGGKREVDFIENFNFLLNVTETSSPGNTYYVLNEQTVTYVIYLLIFYYTFLYHFLSDNGGIKLGIEFRDNFFNDIEEQMRIASTRETGVNYRAATDAVQARADAAAKARADATAAKARADATAAKARADATAAKARAATAASDRVQQRLARLYGGKRKEASRLSFSKKSSSIIDKLRKNKSRKNKSRKNKSRKNKSRKNKSRKNKSRKINRVNK